MPKGQPPRPKSKYKRDETGKSYQRTNTRQTGERTTTRLETGKRPKWQGGGVGTLETRKVVDSPNKRVGRKTKGKK